MTTFLLALLAFGPLHAQTAIEFDLVIVTDDEIDQDTPISAPAQTLPSAGQTPGDSDTCGSGFQVHFSGLNYSEGNGWSGTGGGEYRLHESNPWFLAPEGTLVSYCIDHGGADKFSLPIEEAKVEIQKTLEEVYGQVALRNSQENAIYFPGSEAHADHHLSSAILYTGNNEEEGHFARSFPKVNVPADEIFDDEKRFMIASTFNLVEDCKDAQLEIILGNTENPKAKQLLNSIGKENFKKIGGTAIKTEVGDFSKMSKGFIYLAADKGEYRYQALDDGQPMIYTISNDEGPFMARSQGLWRLHKGLAPFYNDFDNLFAYSSIDEDHKEYRKFKHQIVPLIRPILAHELFHTMGLGHNSALRLMDVDYPATILNIGFEFTGNYKSLVRFLERGTSATKEDIVFMNESYSFKITDFIGLEKHPDMSDDEGYVDLLKSPALKEFFSKAKSNIYFADYVNAHTAFAIKDRGTKLALYHLLPPLGEAKHLKTYSLKNLSVCDLSTPTDNIFFRDNFLESKDSLNTAMVLFQLSDLELCGKIDELGLQFKVKRTVSGEGEKITVYDPKTGEFLKIDFLANSMRLVNGGVNRQEPINTSSYHYFFSEEY